MGEWETCGVPLNASLSYGKLADPQTCLDKQMKPHKLEMPWQAQMTPYSWETHTYYCKLPIFYGGYICSKMPIDNCYTKCLNLFNRYYNLFNNSLT